MWQVGIFLAWTWPKLSATCRGGQRGGAKGALPPPWPSKHWLTTSDFCVDIVRERHRYFINYAVVSKKNRYNCRNCLVDSDEIVGDIVILLKNVFSTSSIFSSKIEIVGDIVSFFVIKSRASTENPTPSLNLPRLHYSLAQDTMESTPYTACCICLYFKLRFFVNSKPKKLNWTHLYPHTLQSGNNGQGVKTVLCVIQLYEFNKAKLCFR